MKKLATPLLFLLLFLIPLSVLAHRPDRSLIYLRIYENRDIEGRFEICVNDLNKFLGLNLEKHPSLEDAKVHQQMIQDYILRNAAFSSDLGNHKIVFTGEKVLIWGGMKSNTSYSNQGAILTLDNKYYQ